MSDTMNVVPGVLDGFNTAHTTAGAAITAAGSADTAAMGGAIAAAVGPIGVVAYIPQFLTAMVSTLTQTVDVGMNHTLIGVTTGITKGTTQATDERFA